MNAADGQGEFGKAAGLQALVRRYPWMLRGIILLMPVGLLGVYGWHRLGEGRLHGLDYVCTLLSLFSGLVALLGLSVWAQLRIVSPSTERGLARLSGGTVFLSVLLLLYLGAQGICGWLNLREEARTRRTGTHSDGTSYQSSRILGHMPKRNISAGARLEVDGREIFNYTYHTDSFRRRVVPAVDQTATHKGAVVFFGDSYTFGEGVNDDETLPNQLALQRPDLAVYNYAFSGYGPNHMLARLESLDTRVEVPEEHAIGVYVFIPNHVRRVIGAFSVISWSRHSPYYRLGAQGLPERLGSFQGERTAWTSWYDFFKGDQLIKYLGIDFPVVLGRHDFELTEAIVLRAAQRFQQQFEGAEFYVLLYPESPADEFPARSVGDALRARGLPVLDYSQLLSEAPTYNFFLPCDTHPRPVAHAEVARRLARDLPALDPLQSP